MDQVVGEVCLGLTNSPLAFCGKHFPRRRRVPRSEARGVAIAARDDLPYPAAQKVGSNSQSAQRQQPSLRFC
ncbi:MAG: hypothetical protein H0V54_07085 [Chthoniobacterales bacterium]|nr:hypothetical protein [Chthoniobacterales bacterium]